VHAHTLPGSIIAALIIAALIVGTLFHPIRHRIQRFMDGYLPSEEKGRPGHSEEASTS
jgi:divalent metal cation (Fe/Co/Zn/Cd) transporter